MQKRLKQLAELAGIETVNELELIKFAELITNDLANVVENQGKFLRYDSLADRLKRHWTTKNE